MFTIFDVNAHRIGFVCLFLFMCQNVCILHLFLLILLNLSRSECMLHSFKCQRYTSIQSLNLIVTEAERRCRKKPYSFAWVSIVYESVCFFVENNN